MASVDRSARSATDEASMPSRPRDQTQALRDRLQRSTLSLQSEPDFATPENKYFYEQAPYAPLDAQPGSIRLLRVYHRKAYYDHINSRERWMKRDSQGRLLDQEGLKRWLEQSGQTMITDSDMRVLACEVIDTALSRVHGEYCTVSYCAGDRTNTAVMLVDGHPFNVFANLEHALTCIMRHSKADSILLWVDQICIDQRNGQEKGQQVKTMDQIYSNSRHTYICLDTSTSNDTLEWLWDSDKVLTMQQLRERIHQELLPSQWPPKVTEEAEMDSWSWLGSLHACHTSPWWRRAWVVQELLLSISPTVISPSVNIAWTDLAPLLDWLCQNLQPLLDQLTTLKEDWLSEALEAERRILHEWRTKDDTEFAEQHATYQMRRSKILPRKSFVRALLQFFEPSTVTVTAFDESYKLQRKATFRKVTMWDIRQKYGTEGDAIYYRRLWRAAFDRVQGNARWELVAILKTIIEDIRSEEKIRKILPSVGPERNPRLSRHELAEKRHHLEDLLLIQVGLVPPKRSAHSNHDRLQNLWKARRDRLSQCHSALYNTDRPAIQALLKFKQGARAQFDPLSVLAYSRNCNATDERDHVYAFLGLLHAGFRVDADYSLSNTIVHVLVRTAIRAIQYSETLEVLHHVHQGRDKRGPFLPSWVPDWTSRHRKDPLTAYIANATSATTAPRFNACNGTRAEANTRDRIDGNPQNTILQVRGLRVGVTRQETSNTTGSPDLRVWRVKGKAGHEGAQFAITSRPVVQDDEIWALFGVKMLVLLRPQGVDTYSFLGECVVVNGEPTGEEQNFADVMFGAAIRDADAPGHSEQGVRTICLV